MSARENLAVEKLLLKLRNYLQGISRSKSGRVNRTRTVDGREVIVNITAGGQITVNIGMGTTRLYAWFNGIDRVSYNGSHLSLVSGNRINKGDAEVIDLLRKGIKRVYPDYTKQACEHRRIQPTRQKLRIISGTERCGHMRPY